MIDNEEYIDIAKLHKESQELNDKLNIAKNSMDTIMNQVVNLELQAREELKIKLKNIEKNIENKNELFSEFSRLIKYNKHELVRLRIIYKALYPIAVSPTLSVEFLDVASQLLADIEINLQKRL